jgi:hypothetical protein
MKQGSGCWIQQPSTWQGIKLIDALQADARQYPCLACTTQIEHTNNFLMDPSCVKYTATISCLLQGMHSPPSHSSHQHVRSRVPEAGYRTRTLSGQGSRMRYSILSRATAAVSAGGAGADASVHAVGQGWIDYEALQVEPASIQLSKAAWGCFQANMSELPGMSGVGIICTTA